MQGIWNRWFTRSDKAPIQTVRPRLGRSHPQEWEVGRKRGKVGWKGEGRSRKNTLQVQYRTETNIFLRTPPSIAAIIYLGYSSIPFAKLRARRRWTTHFASVRWRFPSLSPTLVLAVQHCIVRCSLVSALGVHILARHVRAMIYHTVQMSKRIREGNHEASPQRKNSTKEKRKEGLRWQIRRF